MPVSGLRTVAPFLTVSQQTAAPAGLRGTPAPIDPAQLAGALAPLGSSRMLPREAYVDPDVLAWEQRALLHRLDLPGPGRRPRRGRQPTAVSLGGSGVLLTRDEDGALHAFANVCRHRGHELLPCGSSARKRGIVCPYHAWSYRLDGSLLGAPGFRDVDGFDPVQLGLIELPVPEWHGWVFVDRSGAAPGLRRARRRAGGHRRAVPRRRRWSPAGLARVRRRGQLEDHRRELPGVLPLLDDPPRAVPGQPAGERREPRPATATGSAAGWRCATRRRHDVARRPERRASSSTRLDERRSSAR